MSVRMLLPHEEAELARLQVPGAVGASGFGLPPSIGPSGPSGLTGAPPLPPGGGSSGVGLPQLGDLPPTTGPPLMQRLLHVPRSMGPSGYLPLIVGAGALAAEASPQPSPGQLQHAAGLPGAPPPALAPPPQYDQLEDLSVPPHAGPIMSTGRPSEPFYDRLEDLSAPPAPPAPPPLGSLYGRSPEEMAAYEGRMGDAGVMTPPMAVYNPNVPFGEDPAVWRPQLYHGQNAWGDVPLSEPPLFYPMHPEMGRPTPEQYAKGIDAYQRDRAVAEARIAAGHVPEEYSESVDQPAIDSATRARQEAEARASKLGQSIDRVRNAPLGPVPGDRDYIEIPFRAPELAATSGYTTRPELAQQQLADAMLLRVNALQDVPLTPQEQLAKDMASVQEAQSLANSGATGSETFQGFTQDQIDLRDALAAAPGTGPDTPAVGPWKGTAYPQGGRMYPLTSGDAGPIGGEAYESDRARAARQKAGESAASRRKEMDIRQQKIEAKARGMTPTALSIEGKIQAGEPLSWSEAVAGFGPEGGMAHPDVQSYGALKGYLEAVAAAQGTPDPKIIEKLTPKRGGADDSNENWEPVLRGSFAANPDDPDAFIAQAAKDGVPLPLISQWGATLYGASWTNRQKSVIDRMMGSDVGTPPDSGIYLPTM